MMQKTILARLVPRVYMGPVRLNEVPLDVVVPGASGAPVPPVSRPPMVIADAYGFRLYRPN